jgi:hypothetical protein
MSLTQGLSEKLLKILILLKSDFKENEKTEPFS